MEWERRGPINVIRSMLSGFFTWAVKAELVKKNPVRDTRKLLEGHIRPRTINPEQAALLIKHTHPLYRVHTAILYLTGLRLGEFRSLTWSDYSSTGRWLRVNKNLYRDGTRAIKETGYPFTPTKSKRGERVIPLSQLACYLLTNWKKMRDEREDRNPWDLIFPEPDGNPLKERGLREALAAAAILAEKEWNNKIAVLRAEGGSSEPFPEKITPHILRHGCARAWVASGTRLPEAMYLLGHSNIEQTTQYSEWEMSDNDRAARLQSDYLGGDFGGKSNLLGF